VTAPRAWTGEDRGPRPHDALLSLPRWQRRDVLAAEERSRKSGAWSAWERIDFPKGSIGQGWCAEIGTAFKNNVFSVLWRDVPGGYVHLAITSLSQKRPSWWEAQRIKDEVAGTEKTAVEVYPPRGEVVDDADMYHLWVLPEALPFTLFTARAALAKATTK